MAFNPTFANNEMRILRRLYARAGCYRIDCYSALVTEGHRLPKDVLFKQAKNSTSTGLATALSRLLKSNEIRSVENGDIALTPKGKKRLIEETNPALTKRLRG